MVWVSEDQVELNSRGDIYFQRFTSNDARAGTETLVNTVTAGDQEKPSLAVSDNGDFVVAWASFTGFESIYDIKARINLNGAPAGEEFLVNTATASSQTNPDVTYDADGDIVVVWESWHQDGGDRGVYAQRFDANGSKLGGEFLVNTTTAYSQARPTVCSMHGGGFLVLWESWKQDIVTPSGYGVFGKIYDADGSPATPEFQVNSHTNDYQWFGDAEVFDDESFVVVWCSWEQDGSDGGIFLQRFSPDAVKVGSEIMVNRSTTHYQWLPRVRKLSGKDFAVVWSSWKQDGSREGVYAQLFDWAGRRTSFETRVNTYTESFQWEPDFVATGPSEILVVWSSWGQTGHDYEIVGKRLAPERPQGSINPSTYIQTAGRSTSSLVVHVVDSTSLTGNIYEVSFDVPAERQAVAHVVNLNTADSVVAEFPIDQGENVYYRTPTFEGVSVEFVPEFDFELDPGGSFFANHSGSNLIFDVGESSVGAPLLAPIDVVLLWGSTDTLSDGTYVTPTDTALDLSGQPTVLVPFRARNLTDDAPITLLVVELSSTFNQRWDAGERIVFLTPDPYRTQFSNTHAQIATLIPSGSLILPTVGDTNFVFTKRPLTSEDRYRFTTEPGNVVGVEELKSDRPYAFELLQNYPNPFNPTTTIKYNIPHSGRVTLNIYNILGQKVKTLVNEVMPGGTYRVLFEAHALASGVYFYSLGFNNQIATSKMVLLK